MRQEFHADLIPISNTAHKEDRKLVKKSLDSCKSDHTKWTFVYGIYIYIYIYIYEREREREQTMKPTQE